MKYVYVIQSLTHPGRTYIGTTENIRDCVKQHNDGKFMQTKFSMPWRMKKYVAFADGRRALSFEKHLKASVPEMTLPPARRRAAA